MPNIYERKFKVTWVAKVSDKQLVKYLKTRLFWLLKYSTELFLLMETCKDFHFSTLQLGLEFKLAHKLFPSWIFDRYHISIVNRFEQKPYIQRFLSFAKIAEALNDLSGSYSIHKKKSNQQISSFMSSRGDIMFYIPLNSSFV